jgi:bacterioferritin (cytochrome b1)
MATIQPDMVETLNAQVAREFGACFDYLAMAVHLDDESLEHLAHFYYEQSDEERAHAMRIVDYLLEMGQRPVIPAMAEPKPRYESPREIVQASLRQEQEVTRAIHELVWAWLGALAGHRRVTREMIGHKLEFGHVHVQFPALLRISRTVQWIREGARLDAPLPRRAVEETALTGMFITTFVRWLWDASPDFRATRQHLDGALATLEGLGRRVPGGRFGGGPVTAEAGGNAPDDGTAATAGPRASASPEGG